MKSVITNKFFKLYAVLLIGIAVTGCSAERTNPQDARSDKFVPTVFMKLSAKPTQIPEGESIEVGVKLDGTIYETLTVDISIIGDGITINETDSATLTFEPGNSTVFQTITLIAAEDDNVESEVATITFESLMTDDEVFDITSVDNDIMTILITGADSVFENESSVLNLSLSNKPAFDVIVNLSAGTGGSVSPESLTFNADNYTTAQPVSVTGLDDADSDSNIITVTASSSGIADATHDMLCYDDDITLVWGGDISVTEQGSATVTVALSGDPGTLRSVDLLSDNTNSLTLSPAQLDFTSADYSVPQNVTIYGVDDPDAADDAVLISGSGTGIISSDRAVTAEDNDVQGYVFSGLSSMNENEDLILSLNLLYQPVSDVTVSVSVTPDSIPPAASASLPSLIFNPKNYTSPQQVTIHAIDNADPESVTVKITFSTSGIPDLEHSVLIIDNDITLVWGGANTVTEGGNAKITLKLSGNPGITRGVDLSSDNINALTLSQDHLDFTAANYSDPQEITVYGEEDPDAADDAVSISGSGISGSAYTVTVVDNDVQGYVISGGSSIDEGGDLVLNLNLLYQPVSNLTVTIAPTPEDAAFATATPSSLLFTSSDYTTAKQVTIHAIDNADTGSKTVTIIISTPGITDIEHDVLIIDDDITLVWGGAENVTEQGSEVITVALSGDPGVPRTVNILSGNEFVLTLLPEQLDFTSANYSNPQNIMINGENDPDAADDSVSISGWGSGIIGSDYPVKVIDNDVQDYVFSGGTSVNENADLVLSLNLTCDPVADATVTITPNDLSLATASPASVTFTSSDYATVRQITIHAVDNATKGSASVNVTISTPGITDIVHVITILDDDLSIVITGATTLVEGLTSSISVVLDGDPGVTRIVNLVSSDPAVTLNPVQLTFGTGNWNSTQSVTLTGVEDANVFGETAAITASGTGLNNGTREITVQDNDDQEIWIGTGSTANENGDLLLNVRLLSNPVETATVDIVSDDPLVASASPISLTFNSGNYFNNQTVTVHGEEDADHDSETATIRFSYSGIADVTRDVLVIDNDTTVIFGGATGIHESGGTGTVTVRLSGDPGVNRTLTLTSSDTNRMTISPSTMTFTAGGTGNYGTAQNLSLTGLAETVVPDAVDNDVTITASSTGIITNTHIVKYCELRVLTTSIPSDAAAGVDPINGVIEIVFDEKSDYFPVPALTTNIWDGMAYQSAPNTGSLIYWSDEYTLTIEISWIRFPENTQVQWQLTGSFINGGVTAAHTFGTAIDDFVYPILDTGQTTCWDSAGTAVSCTGTGQDGAYNLPNTRSYTASSPSGNNIVTDNVAGIRWKKCTQGQAETDCSGTPPAIDWFSAVNECSALNTASYGGYSDWRLPTFQEIIRLTDFSRSNPAIDPVLFPNTIYTSGTKYFTASVINDTGASTNDKIYAIYYINGIISSTLITGSYYVRCVSGP